MLLLTLLEWLDFSLFPKCLVELLFWAPLIDEVFLLDLDFETFELFLDTTLEVLDAALTTFLLALGFSYE